MSLRVEEVSLALGGHRVLSGASLEVEAGEIVGLRSGDLVFSADFSSLVLMLGCTKGGKRRGSNT